jgi:hypothetical protein
MRKLTAKESTRCLGASLRRSVVGQSDRVIAAVERSGGPMEESCHESFSVPIKDLSYKGLSGR